MGKKFKEAAEAANALKGSRPASLWSEIETQIRSVCSLMVFTISE